MFYFIVAIFLNIPTYILSDLQMHTGFGLVADLQYLLVAIGAYNLCPMRRWRAKLITCIHLIVTSAATCYSLLVYSGWLLPGLSNYMSFSALVILLWWFSFKLITKWDSLPNDKIEPGNIYEVIGRPRSDLQFVAFILSAGTGGTWYVTDGIDCWYFSKQTGKQEKEPYDESALMGKKVVKVCESSHYILNKLNKGNGRKWSLLNNCLTVFRM